MSVHMRKPPTNSVELTITGPSNNKMKLLEVIGDYGFELIPSSIPWREAFPAIANRTLPGICLRGARKKENLTQVELEQRAGIEKRVISEMENNKRPIDLKSAKIFAKILNVNYKIFL